MTCRQWVVSGVMLQAAALATVGRRQRPVLIIMPLCRVKSGPIRLAAAAASRLRALSA